MRVWNYANLMPSGPGRKPDTDPPPGLDWDFYLGPVPWVPFNEMRFLRPQRYFYDYAGGWITDFGTHRFDTVHQIMGRTSRGARLQPGALRRERHGRPA